jgi:hypothetical protein
MVRHNVQSSPRRGATPSQEAGGGARILRQGVALPSTPLLRVLLAPFALVFAAVAGVVFAILLPICGIATIAEAVAKATWSFVRGAMPHTLSRSASRN